MRAIRNCIYSLILFLLASCGPSKEEIQAKDKAKQVSIATVKAAEKESQRADDSITQTAAITNEKAMADSIAIVDSLKKGHHLIAMSEMQPVKGSLAFYCPRKMVEKTAYNVSVLISKADLQTTTIKLETEMAGSMAQPNPETITKGTEARQINIVRKMKVELKFDDEDFRLLSKPDSDDELFETDTEHQWDWVVQPKRTGLFQLIIIVSGYDEKNNKWRSVETPYLFNIDVKVDPRSYFSKLWDFLEEHPEWIFIQVVFPVIAFFAGKKRGKKNKSKSKNQYL